MAKRRYSREQETEGVKDKLGAKYDEEESKISKSLLEQNFIVSEARKDALGEQPHRTVLSGMRLTEEGAARFIDSCVGDMHNSRNDNRVKKSFFGKYDEDGDGLMNLNDFLRLYRDTAKVSLSCMVEYLRPRFSQRFTA